MKENLILLVEDSGDDIDLLLRSFKKWGVLNPVQVVRDGAEAMEYLTGAGIYADRNRHSKPVLILLDLLLPRVSGLELLKWVRSREDLNALPVVVLSGSKNRSDFDRAHLLGANALVVKSRELEALHELIQDLNYFSLATDYHAAAVEFSPEA